MRLDDVTGVVLAGGRGQRMGGVDKGLLLLAGRPLVVRVLDRLQPQVGAVSISANRQVDSYAAFGHPVLADENGDFAGPLAGVLAALSACRTPWLLCVPCDAPMLPLDLAQRLHDAAAREEAAGAVACTGPGDGNGLLQQVQPTFLLLHQRLVLPLRETLARAERSVQRFAAAQGIVRVRFDDESAFANVNTPQDLASMERAWSR